MALSTAFSFILGLCVGKLTLVYGGCSLLLGASLAIMLVYEKPLNQLAPRPSFRPLRANPLVFLVLGSLLFTYVLQLWHPYFDYWTTQPRDNSGDMGLHLTYIQYIAQGGPIRPVNPIFWGQWLHYPLGVDWFTALWVRCGCPVAIALMVTTSLSLLAMMVMLYAWAGLWGLIFFCCSGGVGLGILQAGHWNPMALDLDWKNLILSLVLPQRGYGYALPVGLWLLHVFSKARAHQPLCQSVSQRCLIIVLWGLFPWFHLHSAWVITLALWAWATYKKAYQQWWPELIFSTALAAGISLGLLWGFSGQTGLRWQLGWMVANHHPLRYALANYGGWLLAVAVAWCLVRTTPNIRFFARLGLLWWGLGMSIAFAPWAWDNMKIFIWAVLFTLPLLHAGLAQTPLFHPTRPLQTILKALALSWLVVPGVCLLFHNVISPPIRVVPRQELQAVCALLKHNHIARNLPIATASTYNHPVSLCGYPIVMGYAGHLWSHGIDYRHRALQLQQLMMGKPGWQQTAMQWNVQVVFWGTREDQQFPQSLLLSQPEVKQIGSIPPWGGLYRLNYFPQASSRMKKP